MPLDTSPDESRGIFNFVKEFSLKDEGLFQKALDVFKKVLSSFCAIIFTFYRFISTASTPSKVIFTGLMKPFSSNSILSMQTSRSLAAFLSKGRRW